MPHSSVQDQRYGISVPYTNGVARNYGGWDDAQQSASFTPAEGPAAVHCLLSRATLEGISVFL